MTYTNSKLVSYTKLSPNHSGHRTHSIDRITPHCVVGQCSVETLGNIFAPTSRQASCNYGIGPDGRIGMYVEEKNRSWCSSSNANDQRAVTIECASDTKHPYTMNSTVYATLIKLCVDICKRNGKKKLIWLGDKNKTLNYSQNLMRWYLRFIDGLRISPAREIGFTQDLVILHQRSLHSLEVLLLVEQLQVDYIESENPGMMQNHRKVYSSPLIMQRDVLHQIQDTLSLMKTEES